MIARRIAQQIQKRAALNIMEIIYDPMPISEGGFNPGAELPWADLEILARNRLVWDGAIIKGRDGERICKDGQWEAR